MMCNMCWLKKEWSRSSSRPFWNYKWLIVSYLVGCRGVVVLSLHLLKPLIMSSSDRWWDTGKNRVFETFCNWNGDSFFSVDRGSDTRSIFPRRWQLPMSVKLSGPSTSFNGVMMNGVHCSWEKWVWLQEMIRRSIVSGFTIHFHWSSGREERILYHGMVGPIAISIYLPLDCFKWVCGF